MTDLTIPDHYPTQFGRNWEHLVQQQISRFRNLVTVDTDIRGERKSYNQLELEEMQRVTTRMGKTQLSEIETRKRWLHLEPYNLAKGFDEWDQDLLGDIVLPTSETVQAMAAAAGRTMDDVIIEAALSDEAIVGDKGTDLQPLGSGQTVAVNHVASGTPANSGLTYAKLVKIRSIFGSNEVLGPDGMPGDETPVIAVNQRMLDDLLLNVEEVRNRDYGAAADLRDGKIDRFLGFHFVRTERLPYDAATDISTGVAWVKSGVVLGIGRDFSTRFSVRDDLNETLQIRSKMRIGGTRRQEKKVVKFFVDHSPA